MNITATLDGPFFRQCDVVSNPRSPGCGWGVPLPVDRRSFKRELRTYRASNDARARGQRNGKGDGDTVTIAITTDTLTNASAATAIWLTCSAQTNASCDHVRVTLHADDDAFAGGYDAAVSVSSTSSSFAFDMRQVATVIPLITLIL